MSDDEGQVQETSEEMALPDFEADEEALSAKPSVWSDAEDLKAVYDVPVQVAAVLGHATMQVNQLLKMGRGAVIELDRKVGEAIDVYVNNRLVARGEVVVVDDHLGITMTEIVKSERALLG
jgi:flagellar motor switch protein FliN/FliY